MELLFTIIIFLNIPMAIASFIFAVILLRRGKGNAIYFNFGMATLFLALWISETFFAFFPIFLPYLDWAFPLWADMWDITRFDDIPLFLAFDSALLIKSKITLDAFIGYLPVAMFPFL